MNFASSIKEGLLIEYNNGNFRYDKKKNQKYVELINESFISDTEYIVQHNHHVTDMEWYEKNYEPLIGDQFINAMNKIIEDPYSRQAYIQLLRLGDDPMICTIGMQYLYHPEYHLLDYIVCMRSSSVTEYTMDSAWQAKMFALGVNYLHNHFDKDIKPRWMFWYANSLHLYEEDFKYLLNDNDGQAT